MTFTEVTKEIGNTFLKSKQEAFKGHPLASRIRKDWPGALSSALTLAGTPLNEEEYSLDSSPGLGQWSDAPWLAVFRKDITSSATGGFYPVFLFEPGFETVCLVMGQGAEKLVKAVGKKAALVELSARAVQMRRAAVSWEKEGFSLGPFATMRRASVQSEKKSDTDPWSVSVAFGKRYSLAAMPNDSMISADVIKMIKFYDLLAKDSSMRFTKVDEALEGLKEEGELPEGSVDGAKKVIWHKKFETRVRNSKLVSDVKKLLGTRCQACNFSFESRYGAGMSGYIEAHHKNPIYSLPDEGAILKPTASDFMVLCSNCHRAIHRAGCPDLETFQRSIELK
ncbi:MAG: DUF3578 domain-containing protein [Polaromonas sp.]|nr:DUF3578 domain-containing protein [Polaromonas sp.]